mgnify:CR=1 FL=1|tara:strand:+ start:130 stop:831 length:702 start_codon:yes stop_codon:yes gene_type:complete
MFVKTFDDIWNRAQHISSPYMPKEHAEILYLTALNNPGTIVEIGSWHGRSSVILGNAIKNSGEGHLYCFDHWNLIEGAECIMEQDIWKSWNDNIAYWQLQKVVTSGRAYSQKAAKQWPADKKIDLLFIDGWHEYFESGPLIISAEDIHKYGIKGWLKNGKMVPPEDHQPIFDRGAKVDFDIWAPKVRRGGILILHDLHPDFPGVLKVWQEEVESSNQWNIKKSDNQIGVAIKL